MRIAKPLFECLKMIALFSAVALVVWSMPEYERLHAKDSADNHVTESVRHD